MNFKDRAVKLHSDVLSDPNAMEMQEISKQIAYKQKQEFKYDIPFDVRYIEDPYLHMNEQKVTFDGKPGYKLITKTVYYDEHDKILYESDSLDEYLPPQSRIIHIGTSPVIKSHAFFPKEYKTLSQFAIPIMPSNEPLVGFDDVLQSISVYTNKDNMSNVVLVSHPGMGKTATMQAYAAKHKDDVEIFTVSMAAMNEGGRLSHNLDLLFQELNTYKENSHNNKKLILFIDEFHQWAMYSPESIESLKPQLARSASYGIRIVGATTYDEYRQYIRDNAAFADRFPSHNLPELNDEQVYQILKMKLDKQTVVDPSDEGHIALLRKIVHYSNLHMQNRAQPRKSLDIFDMILAYVKLGLTKFNEEALSRVFYDVVNVRLSFHFNAETIYEELSNRVYDQLFAIDQVIGRAYSIMLGVVNENKPLGAYLFQGSTGVGKTELAKALAKVLFGEDSTILTYDMGEFSKDDVTSPRRFQLTVTDDMIERHPNVILFDEIEKAHADISKMFYSILDEGRLSDKNGRKTSFTNTIIIFTTNVGEEVSRAFSERNIDNAEDARMQIKKSLPNIIRTLSTSDSFPHALLGRIKQVVPFVPLSHSTNRKITQRILSTLEKTFLQKTGVKISYNLEKIINYVTIDYYTDDADAGGARQLANRIEADIMDKISEYILFNPDQHHLYIDTEGKSLLDEGINIATTKIVVKPYHARNDSDDVMSALTAAQYELVKQEKLYEMLDLALQDVGFEKAVNLYSYKPDYIVQAAKKDDVRIDDNPQQLYDNIKDFALNHFKVETYTPNGDYTLGVKNGQLTILEGKI